MASVQFKNVSKRYDEGKLALQNVDLNINDGEFMVLVGPSGCGKSTALRLLAGLDSVSKGELFIDDKAVKRLSPQQRNIAMVFQNYALYPHMSVRGNLEFPLRMLKLPQEKIDQRTQWAAELLHLTEFLEQRPKQLSGGQRQRVAMGRAIVREPQVFLMDEPLSNLDAKLRVQIRSEIAALQRRLNITTLYVTHDQVEAMTLGQRVAVMNNGRIQQVDTPRTLYERPMNTFVARFIGNPGMNIIPCELRREGECLCFDFADQALNVPENGRVAHDTLNRYIGQSIFFGFRPESFSVVEDAHTSVHLELDTIEVLGHEQLLYFTLAQVAGSELVVRLPDSDEFTPGDIVPLRINTRELSFFNEDGIAIYD